MNNERDRLWAIATKAISTAECFLDAYSSAGPHDAYPGHPQWLICHDVVEQWRDFIDTTASGKQENP